jgi:hypothetical protein
MSLIPDTYDGLVSAIKALAEDDSIEFAAYIPVAIHLAEERLVKEIDTEGLHFTDTISTSAGDPVLAKPSGYRLGYDLSFTTSGGIQMMEKRTDDFLKDYWPVTTSVGIPKYYADKSNTEFMVAPAPASAYDFELNYTGNVSSLSNSVQSNYYTEFASDALFYGTMSNMSEFMKDYQIQSVWESKYDRAMQGINNQGRRGRREDGTAPSNPTPSLNTLRGDN